MFAASSDSLMSILILVSGLGHIDGLLLSLGSSKQVLASPLRLRGGAASEVMQSAEEEKALNRKRKYRMDFDGEYGQHYGKVIRTALPAYDWIIDLATMHLRLQKLPKNNVLVLGPGWGEELIGMSHAHPRAHFTLVEPSKQMLDICWARLEKEGISHRFTPINEAFSSSTLPREKRFGAAILLNVLHCMDQKEQAAILEAAADRVAPKGCIIISGHSEPTYSRGERQRSPTLQLHLERFRKAGSAKATITKFRAVDELNGPGLWRIRSDMVAKALETAGCEPPVQVAQVLFNTLWVSQRR